jgi:hypothetical protein
MHEHLYFVAFKSSTMKGRSKATHWLKSRGAVNLFGNNWLLKSERQFAEEIKHEMEPFEDSEVIVVFGLHRSTDWAHAHISEAANSWIRENRVGRGL